MDSAIYNIARTAIMVAESRAKDEGESIGVNTLIARAIKSDLDDVLMGFTWKEVYKREDEYGMKARLLVWEEIIKQVLGDSRFSEGGG